MSDFYTFYIVRDKVLGDIYLASKHSLTPAKLDQFEIISKKISGWEAANTRLLEMKKQEVVMTGGIFDHYRYQRIEHHYGDPDDIQPVVGKWYRLAGIDGWTKRLEIKDYKVDAIRGPFLDCHASSNRLYTSMSTDIATFQRCVIHKGRSRESIANWEEDFGVEYPWGGAS